MKQKYLIDKNNEKRRKIQRGELNENNLKKENWKENGLRKRTEKKK